MDANTWGGFCHRTRENMRSPMPSVDVTLCHPPMENEKSLSGKHGTLVMRSQTHLQHSCPSAVKDRPASFGENCCSNVWHVKWCHNCEQGQAWSLCQSAKTIWLGPTNPSSTKWQTCFLWGWIHVGTGIEATSTNAEPIQLGWVKQDEEWEVFCTPLPPIPESCWELTKCVCTKACTGRCKCFKYGLSCTWLCSCPC